MFAYTTASSPTYSPSTLYPLPYYAHPVPTTRERYLQAIADAQAAREHYISELEEERILASLWQRDALRQAEVRQRQISAAQSTMLRRRAGLLYGEHSCHPVAFSCQSRRQALARHHRWASVPVQRPQIPVNTVEAVFGTLFGDCEGQDGLDLMKQQKLGETFAEQGRKATVCDDRDRFVRTLEAILEAAQETRNLYAFRPSSESTQPSGKADPARAPPCASGRPSVPLTPQPEIQSTRNARERAARKIQRRWRSHSADAAARKDALQTISTLRARLQFLQDTFSFPEHLEFREGSPQQEVPSLLFVPANAAVHSFTHELTKLLTLADAVPSHGNKEVREERRTFVRLVEEALDSVDTRVAKIWGKRVEDAAVVAVATDALDTHSAFVPTDAPQTMNELEVDLLTASVTADDMRKATDEVTYPVVPASPSTRHPLPVGPHILHVDTPQELPLGGDTTPDTPQNDIPSNPPRLSEEGFGAQPNLSTIDDVVVVQVLPADVGAEEATPENLGLGNASPADTTPASSLVQPSEVPLHLGTTETEANAIDTVTTAQEDDIHSPASPASDCAEPFDVVYPDTPPPSSPRGVENTVDLRDITHDGLKLNECDGKLQHEAPVALDDDQSKLKTETDGFEFV